MTEIVYIKENSELIGVNSIVVSNVNNKIWKSVHFLPFDANNCLKIPKIIKRNLKYLKYVIFSWIN
jgi:hypothetical protein